MESENGIRHIVERQFLYEDREGEARPAGPWRQIGEFTGPASYSEAVEFARREVTVYNHPARYRVLRLEVMDTFERRAPGFRPGDVNVIAGDPGAGKAATLHY